MFKFNRNNNIFDTDIFESVFKELENFTEKDLEKELENFIEKELENFTETVTDRYPPSNLVKVSAKKYQLSMAVAGFKKEDLSVEMVDDILTIKGEAHKSSEKVVYVYKQLAQRSFVKTLKVGEMLEVNSVKHENGLLTVDLTVKEPREGSKQTFDIK